MSIRWKPPQSTTVATLRWSMNPVTGDEWYRRSVANRFNALNLVKTGRRLWRQPFERFRQPIDDIDGGNAEVDDAL